MAADADTPEYVPQYGDCLRCGVPGSAITCEVGHALCDGCLATYVLGARKQSGVDNTESLSVLCPADECWCTVSRTPQIPPPNAKLRALSADSPDYVKISEEITKNIKGSKIQNIYVVHNPGLWGIWKCAQASLKHQKRDADPRHFYHGTWRASAGSITRSGVDIRMSGKVNGQAMGQGFYVATAAATSHGYTVPDIYGGRCMIYARVLLGLVGTSGGKDNPDSFGGGWAYAVRREQQVYPEYIIYYTAG